MQQHVRIMLDRRNPVAGEQLGEQPHHHAAVFEHVRDTRRHPQVVLQHVELPCPGPHHVHTGNGRIDVTGHIDALHLGAVLGVVEHLLGGNVSGLEDFLVVVDVVDEAVQRLDALAQAGFRSRPLLGGNDARNDVEGNQALGSRLPRRTPQR
jgi:hypothetical protein